MRPYTNNIKVQTLFVDRIYFLSGKYNYQRKFNKMGSGSSTDTEKIFKIIWSFNTGKQNKYVKIDLREKKTGQARKGKEWNGEREREREREGEKQKRGSELKTPGKMEQGRDQFENG